MIHARTITRSPLRYIADAGDIAGVMPSLAPSQSPTCCHPSRSRSGAGSGASSHRAEEVPMEATHDETSPPTVTVAPSSPRSRRPVVVPPRSASPSWRPRRALLGGAPAICVTTPAASHPEVAVVDGAPLRRRRNTPRGHRYRGVTLRVQTRQGTNSPKVRSTSKPKPSSASTSTTSTRPHRTSSSPSHLSGARDSWERVIAPIGRPLPGCDPPRAVYSRRRPCVCGNRQ